MNSKTSAAVAVLSAVTVLEAGCTPPPPADNCMGRKAGDLIITEIMLDPDGSDTGLEWIEFFNPSDSSIPLTGIVIDSSASSSKPHAIRAGTIGAKSYFTVGDVRSGALPTWINYSYEGDLGALSNSNGEVLLRCGTTQIDKFEWTVGARSGRSRMLNGTVTPDAMTNDNEANWCDTPPGNVYLANNAGTPGAANPECQPEAMAGTCLDNGTARPLRVPVAGDLIITEIMTRPDVAAASTGEWLELLALRDVDLNDVSIATSTSSTRINQMACVGVTVGEYVLIARSGDPFVNGNLPPPKLTFSLSLTDTNTRLFLYRGDAGIDEAAFTTSALGRSWQLEPTKLDAVSNNDPNNFCLAENPWDAGTDLGSPGAPNHPCPGGAGGGSGTGGGSGMGGGTGGGSGTAGGMVTGCFDSSLGANRPIVPPAAGELVITEFMPDPVRTSDMNGEYIETLANASFDLNGIVLANESTGMQMVNSANCLWVDAGTYSLFAKTADPNTNGGLPPVTATFSFDLANSFTGGPRSVIVRSGTTTLDTWTYGSLTAGASWSLRPGLTSPDDNEDAGSVCPTPSTRWIMPDGGLGDRGTPGAPNEMCP